LDLVAIPGFPQKRVPQSDQAWRRSPCCDEDYWTQNKTFFERYNIKSIDDVKDALIKVGQFKPAKVTQIAETSSAR
jgi:hypothetical protein